MPRGPAPILPKPSITMSDGEEVWTTERGEAHASTPVPGVVRITVGGYSKRELLSLFVGRVEAEIAQGRRVSWFGDYSGMTGFDADLRSSLARFTHENRRHFDHVGILVRSWLIALAVTVANVMVGGLLTVYTSREKYERAIANAIAQHAPAA